jgi:hypothetical protein
MAKAKETTSKSAYYRQLFGDNPDWLKEGSNEEVVARWEKDHPGQRMTDRDRQAMANIKSQLRKKHGMVRRRKRRKGKGAAAAPAEQPALAPRRARSSFTALEKLEGLIDECLTLARQQESAGMQDIMRSLRVARRGVAWEMGQPNARE